MLSESTNRPTILLVGTVSVLISSLPSVADTRVDFARDIQPILADHCYTCHGPDSKTRKAKLRLDVRDSAVGKPADQPAIVAGKPHESELVLRLNHEDPDERMPPAEFNKPLTRAQKHLLVTWIEQGAEYGKHWAFGPIDKPHPPVTAADRSSPWVRNDLDRFVLAQLNAKSIEPAKEADRVTWLRRVTQDLTGLPPTIDQLDAFVNDRSHDAYETVVDRLLNSDDYAERMVVTWLDNARYADSNGYQFDNSRKMWPWRDWVIRAFKQNKPFNQFVTEQLAGDLLPKATEDQRVATGFNRNHGFTIEGGVIDEEYRVMYVNDRTTTVGTLFLGMTLECARCHDHKYDPISTKDYYALFAFFNATADGGVGKKSTPIGPFINRDGGQVMVMQHRPRETRVLVGGQFNDPGELVKADTPAVLPPFGDRPRNRLGLAQWLTDKSNPLFARVTVNRMWQQFFGVGLVKTVDNFGVQGEIPRHQELLDFLAADFRDSGWDLHYLIRTIVLSATYRQSSKHRPELKDADNRLLARGPSFRLPAEMIRDQALAVSGLLVQKVGGPSVKPYQPAGIWEDLNAPKSHSEIYTQGTGESLYRKSMYTFWRRAAMHPGMAVFDAPNRDVCSVLRSPTNTPLQALALMHDPIYIEAARNLAERVIRGGLPKPRMSANADASPFVRGVTIKDVSSQYSSDFAAEHVLDRSGLQGDRHGEISHHIAWLNAKDEGLDAWITFDLGRNVDLAGMHVWNYNETRRGLSTRGIREVEILVDENADGSSFRSMGTFIFEKATGTSNYTGKRYDLTRNGAAVKHARLVRFKVRSNHGGDLVGLSEVAFVQASLPDNRTRVARKHVSSNKLVPYIDAIAAAMRHMLSRHATKEELKFLTGLYDRRLAHYRSNHNAAKTLLAIGESPVDPTLEPMAVAAMADVCLAIFNLSETITRK